MKDIIEIMAIVLIVQYMFNIIYFFAYAVNKVKKTKKELLLMFIPFGFIITGLIIAYYFVKESD